jgi:acyl carrier protein
MTNAGVLASDRRMWIMDRLFLLRDVFREVFDDDGLAVTPNTGRGDIADWDSIAHVKLVLSLEEQFAIRFTEDEVSSVRTVGDFLAAIETHKSRGE